MKCRHCKQRHFEYLCPMRAEAREQALRASRVDTEWGDTVLVWVAPDDASEIYVAVTDGDEAGAASAVLTVEEATELSRHLAAAAKAGS